MSLALRLALIATLLACAPTTPHRPDLPTPPSQALADVAREAASILGERVHRLRAVDAARAALSPHLMAASAAAEEASAGLLAPDGVTVAVPCLDAPPEGMRCVPGGPFTRGSDADGHACKQRFGAANRARFNARPEALVWQQTVYMDTHEVTMQDYRACIESERCDVRPEDGRWGPRYTDFSRPQMPVTGVSWFQAVQYCELQGKHLPTEAEWEKAARGPDGALYPWGDAPVTCERAVIRDPELGRSCGVKKRDSETTGRPLAVGSRPAGRYGLYDMIGNAEEWVYDWYTNDYEDCGEACLGTNPRGPCEGEVPCEGRHFKIVKGGSWYWDAGHNTGIHRRPHFPANTPPERFHHFGFRCAATPEEARALVE